MYIDLDHLRAALALRDLTDPAQGPHAIQALCDALVARRRTGRRRPRRARLARRHRARQLRPPVLPARRRRPRRALHPLDRPRRAAAQPDLGGDPGRARRARARSGVARRARRVPRHGLSPRVHRSPPRRRAAPGRPVADPARRRAARRRRPARDDRRGRCRRAARLAVARHAVAAPVHRARPADRRRGGRRRRSDDDWLEIGECGLAAPRVLADAGLAGATGLAMGLGLDRLVMLRKQVPDIRLLRARDPRIAEQMLDLAPYRAVSTMPPIARDLSIAVDAGDTAEDLGDRVRAALGDRAASVETVAVRQRHRRTTRCPPRRAPGSASRPASATCWSASCCAISSAR